MYGLKVYIAPEDIVNKLSDEDKERFNQCVFTNVTRERDGSITIDCVVFNDPDAYIVKAHPRDDALSKEMSEKLYEAARMPVDKRFKL